MTDNDPVANVAIITETTAYSILGVRQTTGRDT